jgi:hypothetical protein
MDYTTLQYSSKCLQRFQTIILEHRALEVTPNEHKVINSDYMSTASQRTFLKNINIGTKFRDSRLFKARRLLRNDKNLQSELQNVLTKALFRRDIKAEETNPISQPSLLTHIFCN